MCNQGERAILLITFFLSITICIPAITINLASIWGTSQNPTSDREFRKSGVLNYGTYFFRNSSLFKPAQPTYQMGMVPPQRATVTGFTFPMEEMTGPKGRRYLASYCTQEAISKRLYVRFRRSPNPWEATEVFP